MDENTELLYKVGHRGSKGLREFPDYGGERVHDIEFNDNCVFLLVKTFVYKY